MDPRIRADCNPTMWIKSRPVTRLRLGYHIGCVTVTPIQLWILWPATLSETGTCLLRRWGTDVNIWYIRRLVDLTEHQPGYCLHIIASISPEGFNIFMSFGDASSLLYSITLFYASGTDVFGICLTYVQSALWTCLPYISFTIKGGVHDLTVFACHMT